MRHHAWLTVPPRAASSKEAAPKARGETLPEGSPHRDYPPLGTYDHLAGYLAEAGWCTWGEVGARELTWSELETWARMTATPLTPWEAKAIKHLSLAYAVAANQARESACPPCWPEREPLSAHEQRRRRSAVKAALRGGLAGG